MKSMGFFARVMLTVVAAALATWILLGAWARWTFPPCAGPQLEVTLCQ